MRLRRKQLRPRDPPKPPLGYVLTPEIACCDARAGDIDLPMHCTTP